MLVMIPMHLTLFLSCIKKKRSEINFSIKFVYKKFLCNPCHNEQTKKMIKIFFYIDRVVMMMQSLISTGENVSHVPNFYF